MKHINDTTVAIVITLSFSLLFIQNDAFEWWYEYTRAHEHWELDEFFAIAISMLIAGTVLAIKKTYMLKKALKKLRNTQKQIRAFEKEKSMREKMAALGQLSSGMAHEINNSLQPILGLSDIIKATTDKEEAHYGYANTISENAMHMRNILQKVMEVSRSKENNVTAQTPIELFNKACSFSNDLIPSTVVVSKGISKKAEEFLSEYTTNISETELIQVLTNLVLNACYAMKNKGEMGIELTYKKVKLTDSIMYGIPKGEYAAICVTDEGCGIEKDKLKTIFEPFYTTKEEGEGTGLGLSVSYGYVRKWGGDIYAKSKVGKGTSITFLIPINKEEQE